MNFGSGREVGKAVFTHLITLALWIQDIRKAGKTPFWTRPGVESASVFVCGIVARLPKLLPSFNSSNQPTQPKGELRS